MSTRKTHNDPFNAAEPVMPWDEAQSAQGTHELNDAEAPYEAPARQRSRYRAPSSRPRLRSRARSSAPLEPSSPPTEDQAPAPMSEAAPSLRKGWDSFASWAPVASVVGKGCGGCAIVISVFFVGMVLLGVVAALLEGTSIDEDYDYSYEVTTAIDEEAGEADIAAQAEARLAGLADDAWLKTAIAASFSSGCEELLGYTTDELGLDEQAYVSWLLSGYSFTQEGAYCFDGYNGEEPEGSVYFNIAGYDASTFCSDFRRAVISYLDTQGISLASRPALTEEQKSAIEALFESRCAQTPVDSDYYYMSCEFTYSDGAWRLDEEDFNEQIESVFGVYGLL